MAKTILIVEDDDRSRKMLSDLLQLNGYNVIQSVDGIDTVLLVRRHRPNLILMDIMLPNISGVVHVAELKADSNLKNIPIIAVTALVMKGDKEKLLNAGCDDYIPKPIAIPDFLETVAKYLS